MPCNIHLQSMLRTTKPIFRASSLCLHMLPLLAGRLSEVGTGYESVRSRYCKLRNQAKHGNPVQDRFIPVIPLTTLIEMTLRELGQVRTSMKTSTRKLTQLHVSGCDPVHAARWVMWSHRERACMPCMWSTDHCKCHSPRVPPKMFVMYWRSNQYTDRTWTGG